MTTGYIDLPVTISLTSIITVTLYVDGTRTDSYSQDGSLITPFKTIQQAVNQVIANGDNVTKPYAINIAAATYSEIISLNDSSLYNIVFIGESAKDTIVGTNVSAITSTSSNAHISDLEFRNIQFNGDITLAGDVSSTTFCSNSALFSNCSQQGNTTGASFTNLNNIVLFNWNSQTAAGNVNFNNVSLATIKGGSQVKSDLVSTFNNANNKPSQFTGSNRILLEASLTTGNTTVDTGTIFQMRLAAMLGVGGTTLTLNGTLIAYNSIIRSNIVAGSGSSFQNHASAWNGTFTNNGVTFLNDSVGSFATVVCGSNSGPLTNAVLTTKNGHITSEQDTVPTTTTNANAGTGATSSVANTTDTAGILNLTLGALATLSAGEQVKVNFNKAYNVAPIIALTPANAITAGNVATFGVYVSSTTTDFSVNFASAGIATDVLKWHYLVIETQ